MQANELLNPRPAATPAQAKAAFALAMAVAETIRELGQVPSGHLYATLMGKISFADYGHLIQILTNAGLVREDASHLLVWVGPHLS